MSNEEESQDGKKRITVAIDRSPEIERLRKENEAIASELKEKRAILEQQAMEQLEKHKTEIMDMARIGKLTDDQLAEIEEKLQDPKQVESIRMLVKIISDQVEKVKTDLPKRKIPDGKTSIIPPSTGEPKDYRELINGLYQTAYGRGATAEQKKDATEKIDQLWKSFLGNKTKVGMKFEDLGNVLDITICPSCGWANESRKGSVIITCAKCGLDYK
jgi:hypothetical protein